MAKNFTRIRVIFADTDAMGIVYHTNYIKWFEIGRSEIMRQLGLPYAEIAGMGYNLPVMEISCRYLSPARYDQVLVIETEIEYVRNASIKFNYSIWDEKQEKRLVEGESVHACMNGTGRVVRFPPYLSERIKTQG